MISCSPWRSPSTRQRRYSSRPSPPASSAPSSTPSACSPQAPAATAGAAAPCPTYDAAQILQLHAALLPFLKG